MEEGQCSQCGCDPCACLELYPVCPSCNNFFDPDPEGDPYLCLRCSPIMQRIKSNQKEEDLKNGH